MMNKSLIEWTDFTWNPVTGCLHGCPYCYAAKQARRFSGDVRLNKGSNQLRKDENGLYVLDNPFKNPATGRVTPHPVGFEPVMHRYRLPMPAQKKKPAKIFVCSMADLFGAWVPDSWIEDVFSACEAAPWHAYLFLTKNPKRYKRDPIWYYSNQEHSRNWWFGATTTGKDDIWTSLLGLAYCRNSFLSIEPLLDRIQLPEGATMPKWVIIGAETGNRKEKVLPKREWIQDIVSACREAGTPVFLKDSLQDIWGEDLIQEWPEGMPMDKGNDVPHCRECEHHKTTQEGKRGERHECEKGHRHITGRHVRTSPPWCPKRREEAQR